VIEGTTFETVYLSILDIAAVWVILVLIWAAIRRYIVRPERLQISAEAAIILIVVFQPYGAPFLHRGFGFAGSGNIPDWPPVGAAFARFPIRHRYPQKHADRGFPRSLVASTIW